MAHSIATDASLLEPDPETISTLHYKPSAERNTQLTHFKAVVVNDVQKLKRNRKSEAQLPNK